MQLFIENLWDLFIDMSFYIVIGLIFAGFLHAFVKKDAILKHIGKNNTSSVVKASVLGVPLPLCSCGVVPTAIHLGKSGASKGAVVSFLTSTPQTGIDSLIATYGMMGPVFAVYRAISAFVSGIISGIATNIFCRKDDIKYTNPPVTSGCGCGCSHEPEPVIEETCSCCSHEPEPVVEETCSCCSHEPEPIIEETCSCCSHEHHEEDNKLSFFAKIKLVFKYAFGELLDEMAVHFLVGLLIAALISTIIPASFFTSLSSSPLLVMLLMVIIGIPMYICSTASIPIAVSLMMQGVTPGAAFVFLFAGPVTNIASLSILIKSLGKKVTSVYLASVAVCAISFGLLFDYMIDITGYEGISNLIYKSDEHTMPLYMIIVAIAFGILIIKSLIKQVKQK